MDASRFPRLLPLKRRIWFHASCRTLADADKDGKLKAEEFILAMHLVDVAKSGQTLPLTLPAELLPPSQRCGASFLCLLGPVCVST